MGLANYVLRPEGRRRVVGFLASNVERICIVLLLLGIAWPLLLVDDRFNEPTRISENALMPGQTATYFGNGDYKALNAYRNEIRLWQQHPDGEEVTRLAQIERILNDAGIDTARQRYNVSYAGRSYVGTNVYGTLRAPRGDATEAMALIASWRRSPSDRVVNEGGVTMLLAIARYFKRWALWSKDIVFVVPGDAAFGAQAFADAYHGNIAPGVQPLTDRAGVLQAAVSLDFYGDTNRYEAINIRYEGANGQLCNLDLVNSAVHIVKHQAGVWAFVQNVVGDDLRDRLKMLGRAVLSQAHGMPLGAHSPFIAYKVDAIALEPWGKEDGRHDDGSFGRVVESVFRSLNNLLEHMHASYFFYLLPSTHRFVSIASYLPAAMLLAATYTIAGLAAYAKANAGSARSSIVEKGAAVVEEPTSMLGPAIARVAVAHIGGVAIWHAISMSLQFGQDWPVVLVLAGAALVGLLLPPIRDTTLQLQVQALAQLVLGLLLSALATVNFPLGLILAAASAPIAFVSRLRALPRWAGYMALLPANPAVWVPALLLAVGKDVPGFLRDAAFAAKYQYCWAPLAVCVVSYSAWLLAVSTLA